MSIKAILLSAAVMASGATASSAATFNFADVADAYFNSAVGPRGKKSEGTFDQVSASPVGAGLTNGGISLISAVGSNTTSGVAAKNVHAFFDSSGNAGPAGLGVCSSGIRSDGVSACSTNFGPNQSDDNITKGETLKIGFSELVAFRDLTFTNSGHKPANGSLLINGTAFQIENGSLAAGAFDAIGSGTEFSFTYGGKNPTQVYLSAANVAAVPLPAGLLLLLGGLGSMVGLRRRKTTAA